jgi:hypothetical protein
VALTATDGVLLMPKSFNFKVAGRNFDFMSPPFDAGNLLFRKTDELIGSEKNFGIGRRSRAFGLRLATALGCKLGCNIH